MTAVTSSSLSSSSSHRAPSSGPGPLLVSISVGIGKISELPPLTPVGMKYRELKIRVDELSDENKKLSVEFKKLNRLFEDHKRQTAINNHLLRQQVRGDHRYRTIRTIPVYARPI